MSQHRIKYPLGPAVCPVCSKEFNRLRWFTQYCSSACRKAWSASKPVRQAQNLSDRLLDEARDRIAELEQDVSTLKARIAIAANRGQAKPFKYDDEDQSAG